MPLNAALLAAAFALAGSPAEGTAPAPPAAVPGPHWRGLGFDRVDVLSEDPGLWLNYDVPMLGASPLIPALRFFEQVKVVFRLPWESVYASASFESQSVTYEMPIRAVPGLYVTGGIQTRLLFPRGFLVGVAYRLGALRIGASMSALTAGSWTDPLALSPIVLPTFGIGFGPEPYSR